MAIRLKLIITLAFVSLTMVNQVSANTHKNAIVVMSDMHLADARSTAYGLNPCMNNKANVVKMLEYLKTNSLQFSTLVLNGDIFEEFKFPASIETYADSTGAKISQTQYLQAVEKENQSIFDGLRALKSSGIELIYLPGNHDMAVDGNVLEEAFPGLFTYKGNGKGAGRYMPAEDIDIEHGHIYDYMAAPIPQGLEKGNGSIIPTGYFVSKMNAENLIHGASSGSGTSATQTALIMSMVKSFSSRQQDTDVMLQLYGLTWTMIGLSLDKVNKDTLNLATGIDKMTDVYHFNQVGIYKDENYNIMPGELYAPILTPEAWAERCRLNGTITDVNFSESLGSAIATELIDSMAFKQMLDNGESKVRLAVFSHTHIPAFELRESKSGKGPVLYVNTGCWSQDGSGISNTFVWIDIHDNQYDVSLNALADDGTVSVKKSATLNSSIAAAITDIRADRQSSDGALYNLQGQRFTNPTSPGLYIRNGKKVVVR